MKKLLAKPVISGGNSTEERIRNLYTYLNDFIETLNKERSTAHLQVLYAGSVLSGTVPAPEAVYAGHLFMAVIGGVPIAAVRHDNLICGRGGDAGTEAALTLNLTGRNMTFSATAVLEKLILIL